MPPLKRGEKGRITCNNPICILKYLDEYERSFGDETHAEQSSAVQRVKDSHAPFSKRGLRTCQRRTFITENIVSVIILANVVSHEYFQVTEARNSLPEGKRPPLLVKIAPDLTEQDKIDIAAVIGRPSVRSQYPYY